MNEQNQTPNVQPNPVQIEFEYKVAFENGLRLNLGVYALDKTGKIDVFSLFIGRPVIEMTFSPT